METIDQLNAKVSGLEKTKSRLQGELEDMTIEVEKVIFFFAKRILIEKF